MEQGAPPNKEEDADKKTGLWRTPRRRRRADTRKNRRKAAGERWLQQRTLALGGREHHIGSRIKTTEVETARRSRPRSRSTSATYNKELNNVTQVWVRYMYFIE
ncbi:hypothetical protein NDU88_001020 [Pleurodeles waltl]|uniref:Uncharacterized protein n=1 Tax=Pleurodeles waltl TaxID=8319 RepID=A0AAV7WLE2_PLEWA|nr:hypothetical protein NDU88_001020 [Pleurodeles waltl]